MSVAFPDLEYHLDPEFMPPSPDGASTQLVPPLSLDPSLGLGLGGDTWGAPPSLMPASPDIMSDVFGHYAEPTPGGTAMDAISGAVEGLGTRPGAQIDKQGIGTTLGDWKMRFMPYIPFLNEP